MNDFLTVIVAVVSGVIGLAILSVILGKNSNTAGVLTSGGSALSSVIQAAVSPVSSSYGSGNLGASSFTSAGALGGLLNI